jgi:Ca2+-binding RTX toxin-like protein
VAYDDVNGQPVSYAIEGGADGALFAIDATTGALTFLKAPDFEEPTDGNANNVYDVNVSGTQGSSIETHTMHVTVTNLDGNDIRGTKHKDVVNADKTVGGQPDLTGEEDNIVGRGGNDRLSGLEGNDIVAGGRGNDKLTGNEGDDVLKGGSSKDKLKGSDGDDTLKGGTGKDKLIGNQGDDVLAGGSGKDKLLGKGGDDTLKSGAGGDVLTGGTGADTFSFGNLKQADRVRDFDANDLIMLKQGSFSGLDAGPLSQADFDDHFTYKNGKLAYDHDGAGGDKGFVFATFSHKPDIGASDILVG